MTLKTHLILFFILSCVNIDNHHVYRVSLTNLIRFFYNCLKTERQNVYWRGPRQFVTQMNLSSWVDNQFIIYLHITLQVIRRNVTCNELMLYRSHHRIKFSNLRRGSRFQILHERWKSIRHSYSPAWLPLTRSHNFWKFFSHFNAFSDLV